MTRLERLAETERRAKAKLEEQRKALAHIQGTRKVEQDKALRKRRYQVGALADAAGLLVLDDVTLAALFALLASLRDVPNPVAVLEGLLCDTVSPVPLAVDESAAVPCLRA